MLTCSPTTLTPHTVKKQVLSLFFSSPKSQFFRYFTARIFFWDSYFPVKWHHLPDKEEEMSFCPKMKSFCCYCSVQSPDGSDHNHEAEGGLDRAGSCSHGRLLQWNCNKGREICKITSVYLFIQSWNFSFTNDVVVVTHIQPHLNFAPFIVCL